jgi:hypothetical protein
MHKTAPVTHQQNACARSPDRFSIDRTRVFLVMPAGMVTLTRAEHRQNSQCRKSKFFLYILSGSERAI